LYEVGSKLQVSRSRETIKEILEYPIEALPSRKISKKTCKHFGIRVGLSEIDGTTIEAIYFPYYKDGELTGFKKKDLTIPKGEDFHFTTVGKVSGSNDLFGQNKLPTGGKKIVTVEGELDVAATWQVGEEKTGYSPSVIGIGGTSWAKQQIGNNLELYKKFQQNIFLFDQDEATPEELKKGVKKGKEALQDAADLLPKLLVATISEKDPNKMLDEGKGEELYWSWQAKAEAYQPDGFIRVSDVFEEATKMPEWGRPWPWPSLTRLTYGRRNGEGMYLGAGVKVGKSEALNEIADFVSQRKGEKIALFKLEEKPAMSIRKMAGKIMKKPFHKPDGNFTQEELIEGVKKVEASNVVFYDSYGATDWDKLKSAIRYAVVVDGVTDVAIDPLTRLTTGRDAAEQNTMLEKIADEISTMAKDIGFFYMFFCHLKAPATGKPHEEGGRVRSNQFTGSRAMMRACYFMVGIERDKTKEDPVERNTSRMVLLEDRAFGQVGSFDIYYDPETGDYKEPDYGEVEF